MSSVTILDLALDAANASFEGGGEKVDGTIISAKWCVVTPGARSPHRYRYRYVRMSVRVGVSSSGDTKQ